MALDFHSQEDTFCELDDYIAYCEIEPTSLQYLDSFEPGEYDKLAVWVDLCNSQGMKVGHFYEDTVLRQCQLPQALTNLWQCYGHIAQRPSFYHHGERHRDVYVRMVWILQKAIEQQRGLIAFCD
jgi:hypothetical protein